MTDTVIVDSLRTPIGRAGKGSFKDVRADDLAATALRALVARNPRVDFAATDEIFMGTALPEKESGLNLARNAALIAGIDHHVPACTVNRFCASSLQAIQMAHHAIAAGAGEQYIAAGAESVSRSTDGPTPERHPDLDGSPTSHYNVYLSMGMTAENVAERCGVSRLSQDEWAAISQGRAVAAQESGHFAREIVSVELADGTIVDRDDGPRPDTTVDVLASLKPAFKEGGTVTAGNACPLNDGAAATLVMSERRAAALGLRPRARVLASAVAALRPEFMGLGPIPAIRRLLDLAEVSIEEVDVVEINEAFAAQVVPCMEELGIEPERLNPFGGAIALGHPFGMTGARIMTTLLNDLDALDGRLGIEAMCVSGGMGQAVLVEKLFS